MFMKIPYKFSKRDFSKNINLSIEFKIACRFESENIFR